MTKMNGRFTKRTRDSESLAKYKFKRAACFNHYKKVLTINC